MEQKPEAAPNPTGPERPREPAATSPSMDALFANMPDHVRIDQRRGVSTGIVGYRGSSK